MIWEELLYEDKVLVFSKYLYMIVPALKKKKNHGIIV